VDDEIFNLHSLKLIIELLGYEATLIKILNKIYFRHPMVLKQ